MKKATYTKLNMQFKNAGKLEDLQTRAFDLTCIFCEVDGVMEKLGKADQDESDSEQNDGDDNSESSEEAAEPAKPRTILRAKRKAFVHTKEEKKQPAKRSARTQIKPKPEYNGDVTESEESEQEENKPMNQPALGRKRKHPSDGPFIDSPLTSKRAKRLSNGSSDQVKEEPKLKVKQPPKKPVVFKAGKWNPETVLVETELEKCGRDMVPEFSCCTVCNMRNLHRAVNINSPQLLE